MADAVRDSNRVPVFIGVSSADGVTPIPVYVDPTTHRVLVDASGGPGLVTATDGETVTFDFSLGTYQRVTLGGNRTLAFSNFNAGQFVVIDLIQDGTGSRTIAAWPAGIKWAGGAAPTLTTTAGKIDTVALICTGAGACQGYVVGQNI